MAGEALNTGSPITWTITAGGAASAPTSLGATGSAVAVNANSRVAGWIGTGTAARATVWNGASATALFSTESQALGLNNDAQPLVVGRSGSQGFVKRVN